MSDLFIFGFGLTVSLFVGTGLASLILIKNRRIEAEEARLAAVVNARESGESRNAG